MSPIAAQWFRDNGCKKVAILDVDYHHGNGTQEMFYRRADVLTISIHADPRQEYPFFLGHADETGKGKGEGFHLNLPLRWYSAWDRYEEAMQTAMKKLEEVRPGGDPGLARPRHLQGRPDLASSSSSTRTICASAR